MATAFKVGLHERIHNALGKRGTSQVRAEAQHIRVVVSPAELRTQFILRKRSQHALDLVGRYAHANTSAAHQDASVSFPISHRTRHQIRNIRVIAHAASAVT